MRLNGTQNHTCALFLVKVVSDEAIMRTANKNKPDPKNVLQRVTITVSVRG